MENDGVKQHSKMTLGVFLRWVVLWFPLALFPLAVFGAGRYPLVLREETISPVVGAPRLLVYLSPVVTVAYMVLIFFVSRQQASDTLHSKIPKVSGLLFYIPLTLLFTTWGAGQTLNGMLDFSQPQTFQTKVVGSTHFKVTPYVQVQDWKNSGEYVYFMGGQASLQRHPVGSIITVTTKRGLFGYEWYAQ